MSLLRELLVCDMMELDLELSGSSSEVLIVIIYLVLSDLHDTVVINASLHYDALAYIFQREVRIFVRHKDKPLTCFLQELVLHS